MQFGFTALIIGIIGILKPTHEIIEHARFLNVTINLIETGYILCVLSGVFAFLSTGKGITLGISAAIINNTNILFLSSGSQVLMKLLSGNRPAETDQEYFLLAAVLLQVAAIAFLSASWLIFSEYEDERGVATIARTSIGTILYIISIVIIFGIGKTSLFLKEKGDVSMTSLGIQKKISPF